MNKIQKIFLSVCLIFVISNFSTSQGIESAGNFLNLFINNKFKEAYSLFDSTVKSKINFEQFSTILPSIESNYGKLSSVIDTSSNVDSNFHVYNFGCKFEKGSINFRIVINKSNQVSGFWITPYTEKSEYKIPEYVNIAKFREIEVEFGKNEWKIKGTLTIPARVQKSPIAILIHGSGPNDRDETIGPNKPFKDIAWGLASNKIAVLRYDKRTKLYGHKMDPKNITVRDEVIEDALEAIQFVKTREDVDTNNIYLIGHSLGAMLAPAIAYEAQNIKGIILLAVPARRLEDLILNQLNYIFSIDNKITDEEKTQLEALKNQIDSLNNKTLSENTQILGMYPNYFYKLAELNPVETVKKLKIPILILQGERDYQVTMEDFEIWKKEVENYNNIKFKSLPDLNHLFMYGIEKSTPEETLKPNNVHKTLIEEINNWINAISER